MWERDFLKKWDMGHRIEAQLFCFGSGDNDEPSGNNDDAPNPSNTGFGPPTTVRSAPSQPQNDREDPAPLPATPALIDIVTMGQGAPAQGGNVSAREEIAMNQLFDDIAMERRMNPPVQVFDMNDASGDFMLNPSLASSPDPNFQADLAAALADSNRRLAGEPMDMNDATGDLMLLNPAIENPMTTGYGPPVVMNPPSQSADISVADSNSLPEFIQDPSGAVFSTSTGQVVANRYAGMPGSDYPEYYGTMMDEVANLNNRGFIGQQMRGILDSGRPFAPNIDMSMPAGKRLRGMTTTNTFDVPFFGETAFSTYTGLDNPNASADSDDGERQAQTVPAQVNPMTNQPRCPEGYVFDEDLQACRVATSSRDRSQMMGGDMYQRQTSLDQAPANVPAGFDFDAANRRFAQSFAAQPGFYRSPMSLTGFTRLS